MKNQQDRKNVLNKVHKHLVSEWCRWPVPSSITLRSTLGKKTKVSEKKKETNGYKKKKIMLLLKSNLGRIHED